MFSREVSPTANPQSAFTGFSLFAHRARVSYAQVRAELPRSDEARVLVESYLRLLGWHSSPLTREDLFAIFDATYTPRSDLKRSKHLAFHQLAVLFVVLALGTLMNMELQPHDPQAHKYFSMAELSLAAGKFWTFNTLESAQALVSDRVQVHQLTCQSLMARFAVYVFGFRLLGSTSPRTVIRICQLRPKCHTRSEVSACEYCRLWVLDSRVLMLIVDGPSQRRIKLEP